MERRESEERQGGELKRRRNGLYHIDPRSDSNSHGSGIEQDTSPSPSAHQRRCLKVCLLIVPQSVRHCRSMPLNNMAAAAPLYSFPPARP